MQKMVIPKVKNWMCSVQLSETTSLGLKTCRVGETIVLYTQLVAEKTLVHWVRNVGEKGLHKSKFFVGRNKAIVLKLRTQCTPDFSPVLRIRIKCFFLPPGYGIPGRYRYKLCPDQGRIISLTMKTSS
jgi:hypothetical protein